MKKLVKRDKDLRLTEIDMKATRRQAQKVLDYIAAAPEAEIRQHHYKNAIPLVNALLDGSLEIPWLPSLLPIESKLYDPFDIRSMSEGYIPFLPKSFGDIYYKFENMIGASVGVFSLSTHENGEYITEFYANEKDGKFSFATAEDGQYVLSKYAVIKDGDLYEWCWFED